MNIKMEPLEPPRAKPMRDNRYVYVDTGQNYWRGCVDGLVALFCCRILFR